ncbi:TPA: hypothetical protein G8M32_002781 [Salmonella enterica]|nr:hypothetical protein [Salmonella enterica]
MGNVEPVLMCREKLGKFCPRQLVSRWFRRELGISVEEDDPRATPQFDFFLSQPRFGGAGFCGNTLTSIQGNFSR